MAQVTPNASYSFYLELLRHARDEWGMGMLFKDDLVRWCSCHSA